MNVKDCNVSLLNEFYDIINAVEKYEIPSNLTIENLQKRMDFLKDSKKKLENLIVTVENSDTQMQVVVAISAIDDRLQFLMRGLTNHLEKNNQDILVHLGGYVNPVGSISLRRSIEALQTTDSSCLCFLKESFRCRDDFKKKNWQTPAAIWTYSNKIVPESLLYRLIHGKKDRASNGIKYFDGDRLTNMEGALQTFVSFVSSICLTGDLLWMGGQNGVFGKPFDDNKVRKVVLSGLVQPDFENDKVLMKIAEINDFPIQGKELHSDYIYPSQDEVWEGSIGIEKMKEYERDLQLHLIFYLTKEGTLPSKNEAKILSSEEAIHWIEQLIAQKETYQSVIEVIKNKAVQLKGRFISLEVIFNMYFHQIKNEMQVLEEVLPSYVYTIDPPSIFLSALGGLRPAGIVFNCLQALAFGCIHRESPLTKLHVIACSDFDDKQMIGRLKAALPDKIIASKQDLFDGNKQCIKYLGECNKDIHFECLNKPLVLHNNSDGFGQNIEFEGPTSLDGMLGNYSDSYKTVERGRKDFYITSKKGVFLPLDSLNVQDVIDDRPFTLQDIITFRAALTSPVLRQKHRDGFELKFGNRKFKVWFNDHYSSINIQNVSDWELRLQHNKLGIIIDEGGQIRSIWINGESQDSEEVPERWLPYLHASFTESLKISSIYQEKTFLYADPVITVGIVRRGLKEVPEYHLHNLCQLLVEQTKKNGNPKIEVSFLNDDMSKSDGLDAGGLARDYLDELVSGLQVKELSFELQNPCYFPQAKGKDSIPLLDRDEKDLFESLGQLMMFCWNSKGTEENQFQTAQIGNHFELGLFQGILSLSSEEIDTSFESLPLSTKLKMAKVLIERKMDLDQKNADSLKFQYLTPLLVLMGEKELDQECINLFIDYLDLEDEEIVTEEQKERFKEALLSYILSESRIGNKLSGIHAIAKGMKSVCKPGEEFCEDNSTWDLKVKKSSALEFSHKIQGSQDRQLIVESFAFENISEQDFKEIEKKVNWLQEWLLDKTHGASDEEVIEFLKYATGSSGLPMHIKIVVVCHIGTKQDPHKPFPEAHTCSMRLRISPVPCSYGKYNDFTKENYIESLKDLALFNKSMYNMD